MIDFQRGVTPIEQIRDGRPTAVGRWQPTRAGVVNSWAWSEETFPFADGWLALTGPNGSGKSLTSSMWVTPLFDADVSQKALSIDGSASGTLISRHTDRDERKNLTGLWWMEYGRREQDDESVRYVTTGLWLRSVGGELQRAFFFTPGRVGYEITLVDEARNPATIVDLAAQVAAMDGRIFTNSAAVRSKALTHLVAVTDESDFRRTIREELFRPLDEVQFAALNSVLRSLRSVRTGQGVSPEAMRRVLTEAMPALDADRLTPVAEAMERISDLEKRLESTTEEIKLLADVETRYSRYTRAVVAAEAAALLAANARFDDHTREERSATERMHAAREALQRAIDARKKLRSDVAVLEGEREAATAALRDHAGADLPHLEERASDTAEQAARDTTTAETTRADAEAAKRQSEEEIGRVLRVQEQVRQISESVRAAASSVSAASATDQLVLAGKDIADEVVKVTSSPNRPTSEVETASSDEDLASSVPSPPLPATAPRERASTPLAWIEMRESQLEAIDASLAAHSTALADEQAAASARRQAEADEDEARVNADAATVLRELHQSELEDALEVWIPTLRELPSPPATLLQSDDRIEAATLSRWLASAMTETESRIDYPGHVNNVERCADRLLEARKAAEEVRKHHQDAEGQWRSAQAALENTSVKAEQERLLDVSAEHEVRAAHSLELSVAERVRSDAAAQLKEAEKFADEAVRDFIVQIECWRSGLVQLDSAGIMVPDEREALALDALQLATERAFTTTTARIQSDMSAARRDVSDAKDVVRDVQDRLDGARRAAPVPPPPVWRRRRDGALPLWSLVDFADDLNESERNALEGSLLVGGLLDALVSPDGTLDAGELTLTGASPVPGRTLADVLRAETDTTIPAEVLGSLLRAIPIDGGDRAGGSNRVNGVLDIGVLTAVAPQDYRAAFIGRTARERARTALVAQLMAEEESALEGLSSAEAALATVQSNLAQAVAERDALPPGDVVQASREAVVLRRADVGIADTRATEIEGQAALTLQVKLSELTRREANRSSGLERLAGELRLRDEAVAASAAIIDAADEAAASRKSEMESAQAALAEAEEAGARALVERSAFPDLTDLENACTAEDRADEELSRAAAEWLKRRVAHEGLSTAVGERLRELNRAARTPDGALLPTDLSTMRKYRRNLETLRSAINAWVNAVERVGEMLVVARRELGRASRLAAAASAADRLARSSRDSAAKAKAKADKTRELFGAEYAQLLKTAQGLAEQIKTANEKAETLIDEQQAAASEEADASQVLAGIAPQREEAEQLRDERLAQMRRLVDEALVSVSEGIALDDSGRPAHLTAAVAWARRLMAKQPSAPGTNRASVLMKARGQRLDELDKSARAVSRALTRFDRQVTVVPIEGTEWRRAEVAVPDIDHGEDLSSAMVALRESAAQLESDLRDDVKRTLKTSMFTQLRKDIQLRREMAQDLERRISQTLHGVRTGVANVGVRVSWDVKDDEDARQMVQLITAPTSDETFERMYQVLRARMDETAGQPWATRVEHTFDYRAWHEWRIEVTHKNFTPKRGVAQEGSGSEVFKLVTARSNPLTELSTGERRLVTMLPLLAAAWSMYSGDFAGPRLVSIDELDATFDDANLRQVLALLRSWKLDVIATAPSMSPLIKAEAGQVVIQEVVTAGDLRVTVPWLWAGSGEPQPLTFDLELSGKE